MHVEFRVLGPLEIRRAGAPLPLRAAKQRLFLADLLVHRHEVVSVDRLVEDVWPTSPPVGARHALEAHASRLRNMLGDDVPLLARAPGYILDVDPQSIDSVRFEQLLEEARDALGADPARASARATDALALWRGDAYADFAFEAFAQEEIARLEELRKEAEEERIDAELALGRNDELIGELEALVVASPLRERRRGQLMLALYRAGRQADALEAFREARELLVEELGLEPSEELRKLERRILLQDAGLASEAAPRTKSRVARRLVTVVAVEPEISLDLDPEEHDRQTRRAADAVAAVAEEYAADRPEAFILAFAHEDHAHRAVAAATALREELGMRIGLASGEALVGDGVLGGPVVARARQHARDGGADEPPVATIERRTHRPFVGRQRELERLRDAHAAVVVGPPGIGKSRLAEELAGETFAVFGRCSSFGVASLAPLNEIAAALGAPEALAEAWASEVPATFRRLCEATGRPVLVVVDDAQWADGLVLDTLEHLVEHGTEQVRVLCLSREELIDEHPSVLSGAERIVLEPLEPADAHALAAHVANVDAGVIERALTAAEGNPLFIEQLLAHAGDGAQSIPPTIQSLLTARLDRLTARERTVIEHAAVIGREFDGSLLADLLDVGSARQSLAALIRRGFLDRAPSTAPFEDRFRFRHALIHEAAYAAAPRSERSRLHEKVADLLAADADELIGFHLERAVELRPERDRHARQLASDAGTHLGDAGIAWWKLGYVTHAAALLARATHLLGRDERRRELLCELGIALNRAGETAKAEAALEEAVQLALSAADRRLELRGRIELAAIRMLGDAGGDVTELSELLAEALPLFETLGDERSLGRAWLLSGWVQGGLYCRYEAWGDCATHALKHYRAAGFPSSTCIGHIAAAAYLGPTPATAAISRCKALLETEVDDRPGEASVRVYLGGLEGMRGNFDEATEHVAAARAIYEDLGHAAPLLLTCAPVEAQILRWQGDLDNAAAILIDCCSALQERANWFSFSSHAATLADVLLTLGRDDDAERWLNAARFHGRPEDLDSRIPIAAVNARLLGRSGDHTAAEAALNDSLQLAEETDALNLRAQVLVAAAEVFATTHADDDAAAALERASALYAEKENAAAAALLREAAAASKLGNV